MKLKFFGLAAAMALLASCSSDDKGGISASKLVGKWYPIYYKVSGATIPYDGHESCGKDYTEFLENGLLKDIDVYQCQTSTDTGTWTLNGDKVTVTFDAETSTTATIKKLDGKTLEVEFTEDFDDNGTMETVSQTYTNDPSSL